MVGIFKNWTEREQKIVNTCMPPDEDNIVLILNDDGFLPDGATSPYRCLTDSSDKKDRIHGPLFADLLPVPELWEIRMFYDKAEIWDEGIKKAEILYADPAGEHCVKAVRWVMQDGFHYKTDHYDKDGRCYCSDLYDEKGTVDIRFYYAEDNSVLLTWSPKNGTVIWMEHGRMAGIYDSPEDFLTDFCNRSLDPDQIILFDDIELAKAMPGLHRKQEFAQFIFRRNKCSKDLLILTNSDQIEQLEPLVQALPELHFHIGAITLMSDKLMALGRYEHVSLYPGITEVKRMELYNQCFCYLDINYYQEICDAVREAYKNGLLILGFDTTIHHAEYVLPEYIFRRDQAEDMIRCLQSIYANKELLKELVKKQWMLL